jgi:5-methylthioadenosine/S-adenosylhomocysteine deaminase
MNFDLGIRCDYLLSMTKNSWDRDFFIGVTGSKIIEVAPWKNQKAKKFIDAKNKVVLPGLINSHNHLAMSLFKGVADDDSLQKWLYDYILPLEAKLLNPEFVRIGTELATLESISFGVTTTCDMYYFEDVVGDVLDRAGVRGLIGEAILDFPVPDNKDQSGNDFKILDKMRERFKSHERITPCLAPHSPYACGDETIKKVVKYADKYDLKILMHLSETEKEMHDSQTQFQMTPLKRMEKLGLLEHHCIFAHCVCITEQDIDLIVDKNCGVAYCPESNMKLGSGVAPIPKLLSKGARVGLGTDGSASNNDLSLFREMDCGAKLQKLSSKDPMAMSAFQALQLATIKGAQALGIENKVGSLEVGKEADIIIVDLSSPHMQPVNNVISQLVYSTSGLEVDTVICNGKILFEGHQVLSLDQEKILSEAKRMQSKIQGFLK